MNTVAGFIGNMFVRGIVSLTVFVKRKDILAKLGLGQADRTLAEAKSKAQTTTREVSRTIHRGKDLTERAILRGENVAGKIHPGILAASQLFQRTKQQHATPVKQSNAKPSEIAYGRKKQLPFEGEKLLVENKPNIGPPPVKMQRPRKTIEPPSVQVATPIGDPIPLSVSALPIDKLIKNGKAGGKRNRKMSLVQPSKNYVGQSVPLTQKTPKLIANDSLTQQITQLKQSRSMITNQNSLQSMQQISGHTKNNRTIKMTGSSKEQIHVDPGSSDHSKSIVLDQSIEGKLGKDFSLPEGRSPQ